MPTLCGIENYYPNTLLDHLKQPAWTELLGLIGDEAMVTILEGCFIFVRLALGPYVQVAGVPVSELRPTKLTSCTAVASRRLPRHAMLYCQDPSPPSGLPPKRT